MRQFFLLFLFLACYFAQAQKKCWQLSALQGYSYSRGGEYSVSYLDNAYRSISILDMPSFKIGVSKTRQLKKWLDLEFGLNYQFIQYKVVYEPVDSASAYGVVLSDHRKFNFFEAHATFLKNLYVSKNWFFTIGGGTAFHYAFYMTSSGINRGKYNPLRPSYFDLENYERKMTEQPTFNYSYFALLGVGKRLGAGRQEISLRAFIQQLQGSYRYNSTFNTSLYVKGIAILYTFGKTPN